MAEGVISHNCFARNTHTYLDLDAGADFDRQIVVKVNVARVLRRELRSPRWSGEPVAMGTNTDPYQRAEGRYRLMPGIIDAFARAGTPFSVLTKGTVLCGTCRARRGRRGRAGLAGCVGRARSTGRCTPRWSPAPRPRPRASTSCGASPTRPAVRRDGGAGAAAAHRLRRGARRLLGRVAAAGATGASVLALHLRPGTREWFLAWLEREHPELVEPYARLYRRGAYVTPEYRRALAARVAPLLRRHGLDRGSEPTVRAAPPIPTEPSPEAEQLALL